MTDEKLAWWLDFYDAALAAQCARDPYSPQLHHARSMLKQMRGFLRDGRREKLMRWIGFIQGVCWCNRVFTIDELKAHNLPVEPAYHVEVIKPNP